jgi:hypothetical protein
MKLISILLIVLILVKMNNATKKYFHKTNNWTIEEHILLDKQLDGNPININMISKNLNKSIEEVNAQIQEFIYIIYIKKITKKIVKKTGFTEKLIIDTINDKSEINKIKNEIKELKMIIKNLCKQKTQGEEWY